jgi:hypothetical protein
VSSIYRKSLLYDFRQRSRLNLVVALYRYITLPTVNEILYYKIYRTDFYIWKAELTFTSLGTLGRVCETLSSLVYEIYQGLWSLTGHYGLWDSDQWPGIVSYVTTGHRQGIVLRIRTDHWRDSAAHVWATSKARCISLLSRGTNRVRKFQLTLNYIRLNGCVYQRYSVQKTYKEKCSYDYVKQFIGCAVANFSVNTIVLRDASVRDLA